MVRLQPVVPAWASVASQDTVAQTARPPGTALLLNMVSSVLPHYTKDEARHCLTPTAIHNAGWFNPHDFEEAIRLFVQCDASAPPTTTTPSSAGCTSGGLGAQDATASVRGTDSTCDPSPLLPRDVPGTEVPPDNEDAQAAAPLSNPPLNLLAKHNLSDGVGVGCSLPTQALDEDATPVIGIPTRPGWMNAVAQLSKWRN